MLALMPMNSNLIALSIAYTMSSSNGLLVNAHSNLILLIC